MTAAVVVKFTYGRDVVSTDDELVRVSVAATVKGVALGIPGMTPIDLFPFCELRSFIPFLLAPLFFFEKGVHPMFLT